MMTTNRVAFDDAPRCEHVDEETVNLVFLATHEAGGRTKASIAIPCAIARDGKTVALARARAEAYCQLHGAGGAMSVSVLMGW